MLYIFGSLLVSHLVTCVVLTFYQLNDSRLINTILLSFQFLMLAVHFILKIKQIQNEKIQISVKVCIKISLLLIIFQRKQCLVQSFLAGSYMQYLLKKQSIYLKLINALICMFYFVMWGETNENTITGTLLSLFMVLNICMKYYIQNKKEKDSLGCVSTVKLPSPELIKNQTSPNYSRKVSGHEYQSEPSNELQINDFGCMDQYQKIFNMFPDGIIMVNMKKQVIFINKHLKKMMGGMNKKAAFYNLLQMKNVQQQINELEQINSLFQEQQIVLNEQEFDNKTYFKKSTFDESRYDDQSELKSSYSFQQFETVKKLLDHLIENRNEKHGVIKMLCQFPQNEKSLFQVSFKKFENKQSEFVLLIVRDMTSMNLVTFLQRVIADKSKFLSTVVHEFRTPLQSIKLMVQQIQPMCSEEMVQKYLLPMLSQLDCFTNLIQDLLDVSVLNVGKFKLDIQQLNLHHLITETYNIMVVQAYAKNNDLVLNLKGIPEKICSDPYKIRQILINLLGNSVKFTYNGIITISGKTVNKSVELTVSDTGLGITAANQNKLFTEFGKLDDPTNSNPQGIGLGLMISNVLARKLSYDQKGLSAVSDGEGKGSKFSFQVYDHSFNEEKQKYQQESVVRQQREYFQAPLNQIKQCDSFRMSGLELSQYSRCQCPEILIVDDQPFILQMLKQQLESQGYRVNLAFSGFECIKKIEQFQHGPTCACKNYKIVILDIDLPNLNGIETCKRIINMGYNGYILGHSGYSGGQEEEECLKAGMVGYFVKPLEIGKLQQWLEQNRILL
ncbi:unnamed protein product [Paramecium sonneborni]|uniref:Uncharacterized protein n=1 Tax=Paramecium sonneborni TaxID=65129 RepID=A0A8S1LEA1_9CILI|nr:unnamed protein product [Paramecium sonneborni]